MRITVIFTLLAVLIGCGGGKYVVKQPDNRFSENKNPVYMAENNRISTKSIAGGVHIDDKGVFINPFIEKDKATNSLVYLGFIVVNKTDYTTKYGGVNQLGVIKNMTFRLNNGDLISLDVHNQDNQSSDTVQYNTATQFAYYDKLESGLVSISKDDFKNLADATRVSCKITGTKRSVVYEEKDITKTFLSNLKQFNTSYVQ